MKSAVLVLLCAATATAMRSPRCYKPIEPGKCLAYMPRFAFDKKTGECVRFIYGGCGGNNNNFHTKSACERACMRNRASLRFPEISFLPSFTEEDPLCTLPLETGPCYALIPRYGFDPNLGQCVRFAYGGCQGNANNFETMEECEMNCLENTPVPIPLRAKIII
ncbi:Kunitz/Bovine pancreatic trypsin inhibitor domain protein [Ancylostoma caninum]|uniref:Kunitz/Bovine pancreatic trypsin inhibitor domain protein n=1 Tax=Ancylostoma caninum TaxID=29170 RepID=A0A368FTW0_ANCCA|nr:Kunitz/Bovine pancreatic trypsin inhibitor domain protein [Ancylostoma caninum]RCN35960.1 Kunitz/Bovine pancreatic trypsin inhibitor domain protein [Ancylostoma caninum]